LNGEIVWETSLFGQLKRHFYVNDVGRQVAIASYGYKMLGLPPITGKPDKHIGLIYTATNCAIEIDYP